MLPNLTRKRLANIPLSETCKSIVLGTILGDGSLNIQKGYKNARLTIKHSIIQQSYFNWLASSLNEIANPGSVILCKPSGFSKFSKNEKLQFQSKSCENLTKIHEITYKKNKLDIKRSWLNHLTPLSLMVWWLDDGSLVGGGRQGVLCTDGFDKKSVEIIVQYLEKVWNVKGRIGVTRGTKGTKYENKEYYKIYLGTSELKKFLIIIMPEIPIKEMVYKVTLKYKDKEMQQRWISTMKEHMKAHIIEENDIVQ